MFYLPFCKLFSSGDALHSDLSSSVAPNVLFVGRDDFKRDLKEIAGLDQIGAGLENRPPYRPDSPTSKAWNMMSPLPSGVPQGKLQLSPEVSAKMLEHFKSLMKDGMPPKVPFSGTQEDFDFTILKQTVRPTGPCVCGSTKSFKECCGRDLENPPGREKET